MAPEGSGTVVWRSPVGRPQPIGGDHAANTGSWRAPPVMMGAGCPALA